MALLISKEVTQKLKEKHKVSPHEIVECFVNRECGYLEDTREQHRTDPATQWFISENNYGRKLKVVFIHLGSDIRIRTAFEPNDTESYIYWKYCKEGLL